MERKINLFESVPTGTEGAAIQEVLDSHWWGSGKKAREFEEQFAASVGAEYAIATNSCTSALEIAVAVAPLGDEVSVSAFTFVSSALAILKAGKKVKFIDIDPDTLCTPKADIQVLYAGNDAGEGIIYDMAHFGGGKHKGLISCWSFQARKNLPTGDGGMITTNDEALYKRAKALSWCGIDKSTLDRSKEGYSWDYDIKEVGFKADITDIIAAIGLEQLKFLKRNNEKRALVASWYDKYLPERIKRPFPSTTWHLYTIQVPNRDDLYAWLAQNGVSAGVHYKPLTRYPIFPQTPLQATDAAYEHILSLPMHVNLSESDVMYVCDIISKAI